MDETIFVDSELKIRHFAFEIETTVDNFLLAPRIEQTIGFGSVRSLDELFLERTAGPPVIIELAGAEVLPSLLAREREGGCAVLRKVLF